MASDLRFYNEDGQGHIYDEDGREAMAVDEIPSFRLTKLKILQNFIKHTEVDMSGLSEGYDTTMKDAPKKKDRAAEYTKYTPYQREAYIHYAFEKGLTHDESCRLANVNKYTARKWRAEYKSNPDAGVPEKKTNKTGKQRISQLNEQHKDILIRFYDEKPIATIQDGVEALTNSFEGLTIKKTRVAEFMKNECNLSLKSIARNPVQQNSTKTVEARAAWVAEWVAKGIDYHNNCMFVDESCFNVNMTRGRAWSKKGEPAIEETPSTKAVSKTALGAVSSAGVVNVSIREAGNVKRKVAGATKRKAPEDWLNLPKGTTGNHFMQSAVDTVDIMDQFPEMRGYHIVTDNAPIHVHNIVDPIIIRREYIPVYLPPYSPELNSIEQLWKDLKDYVKRDKLEDNETLTSRMMDACEKVTLQNIRNYIQHSINILPKCLNKEPI
ncbi:SCF ubiquitin ligase complex subunit cdc4 [Mucor velutinosus]|uniref:SCF ubiquitin ligase complex subunit cdc4 n=1 Tax=Mucor velutinosus TaxID=708070 RepID=A0AAN7DA99_9FUNG|nr:SCF ubiquitin ligase complex subunit cdc4 [Mucor velutinosus]